MIPVGLGLKLLGFGKSIKNFIVSNWKWILPIVLVLGAYWYHTSSVESAYERGIEQGVANEVERQRQRIEIENRKNREFEKLLSRAITDFGKEIARETAQRVVKENQIKARVETIIRENPVYQDCKVDPEVIEARNNIRRFGPNPPVVTVKFK